MSAAQFDPQLLAIAQLLKQQLAQGGSLPGLETKGSSPSSSTALVCAPTEDGSLVCAPAGSGRAAHSIEEFLGTKPLGYVPIEPPAPSEEQKQKRLKYEKARAKMVPDFLKGVNIQQSAIERQVMVTVPTTSLDEFCSADCRFPKIVIKNDLAAGIFRDAIRFGLTPPAEGERLGGNTQRMLLISLHAQRVQSDFPFELGLRAFQATGDHLVPHRHFSSSGMIDSETGLPVASCLMIAPHETAKLDEVIFDNPLVSPTHTAVAEIVEKQRWWLATKEMLLEGIGGDLHHEGVHSFRRDSLIAAAAIANQDYMGFDLEKDKIYGNQLNVDLLPASDITRRNFLLVPKENGTRLIKFLLNIIMEKRLTDASELSFDFVPNIPRAKAESAARSGAAAVFLSHLSGETAIQEAAKPRSCRVLLKFKYILF